MESTIEKLPTSRVKVTVSLNAVEFKHYYDHALDHLIEHLKLPGFRVGKVPRNLAENHFGAATILQEALEDAVPQSYYQAVLKHDLHPLHQPEVNVTKLEKELSFTAEVDEMPSVELKNWRGIKIKKTEPEKIDEAAVDQIVQRLQKQKAELLSVDRGLQKGDFASVSFSGKVGGIKHEAMQSENHPLVVGEGSLIPGFEDELVGMKPGEEKTFDVTFPKDYRETSLAKKKAQFTVKLLEMKEVKMPELNDTFAGNFGKETLESLRQSIKDELETEAGREAQHKNEEAVLGELAKRTKAVLPKSLVEKEIDRIVEMIKQRLGVEDEGFAMYLEREQKTPVTFREDVRGQAESNALVGLALGEIMKEEKLDPEDKDSIKKALDLLLQNAVR